MHVDPRILTAIADFPPEFGLRGHDGVFRISRDASYVADASRFSPGVPRVVLYTDIRQPDGTWSNFAKGSPEEIAEQIVPLRRANRTGSNYATESSAAYDQRSKNEARADAARTARDWAQASPRERREDEAAFLDALKDPSLIAERVSWLIDGNYGRGQYLNAREVLRNARMNRKAWLVTTIGEAEWRLPRAVAARVWTRLNPTQRAALDRAMESIIRTPLDEDS